VESSLHRPSPPNTYFYVQDKNLGSSRNFVENDIVYVYYQPNTCITIHTRSVDGLDYDNLSKILVGKSVWNSTEFCDYSNSGPFELRNFHRNLFFPIIKCDLANSEHVSSGSESSPTIDSSNFMNWKMFPHDDFFGLFRKISCDISAGRPNTA
jgi:hypothetical protein